MRAIKIAKKFQTDALPKDDGVLVRVSPRRARLIRKPISTVSECFAKSGLYLNTDIVGPVLLGDFQTHTRDPTSLEPNPVCEVHYRNAPIEDGAPASAKIPSALPLRQPLQHRVKTKTARAHQRGAEHLRGVVRELAGEAARNLLAAVDGVKPVPHRSDPLLLGLKRAHPARRTRVFGRMVAVCSVECVVDELCGGCEVAWIKSRRAQIEPAAGGPHLACACG